MRTQGSLKWIESQKANPGYWRTTSAWTPLQSLRLRHSRIRPWSVQRYNRHRGKSASWVLSRPTPIASNVQYTLCLKKNIPDIFDRKLQTNYQISIIFGTNIPDTTCHQMTVQFPTSLNVCFCTTQGKQQAKYALKETKPEKTSPTLSIVPWIKISRF